MTQEILKLTAYTEIRSRITSFRLLPGDRISDKKIASEMGISRSPVREALIRLSGEGLVQEITNKGFRVKTFSLKEIEELYTVRETLEVLAVRLATPKMNEERIRQMRRLIATYPGLIESRDLAGFNSADEAFHDNIAQFSENELLATTLKKHHGQIRIVRRYDHLQKDSCSETLEEHTHILNLMIRDEVEQAQKSMSAHINGSMKAIMAMVRSAIQ